MVLEGTAYNGVTRAKNITKKELGMPCLCYTNRKNDYLCILLHI